MCLDHEYLPEVKEKKSTSPKGRPNRAGGCRAPGPQPARRPAASGGHTWQSRQKVQLIIKANEKTGKPANKREGEEDRGPSNARSTSSESTGDTRETQSRRERSRRSCPAQARGRGRGVGWSLQTKWASKAREALPLGRGEFGAREVRLGVNRKHRRRSNLRCPIRS